MEAYEQGKAGSRAGDGGVQNERLKTIPHGVEETLRVLFYEKDGTTPRKGRRLKDFKEYGGWFLARRCFFVDSQEFDVHPGICVGSKCEVERMEHMERVRAAAGSLGGRARKANSKQTASKATGNEGANGKQTDGNEEANGSIGIGKGKGKYIIPTPTSDARDAGAGARAREVGSGSEAGVGVEPIGSESEEDLEARLKWAQDAGGVLRGLSGNPVGLANILAVTPDVRLPEFAIALCREGNRERALKGYDEAMAEMGAGRFRLLLEQFVGDIKEGHEPKSRGAAFMARVMSGLKALRARKEG